MYNPHHLSEETQLSYSRGIHEYIKSFYDDGHNYPTISYYPTGGQHTVILTMRGFDGINRNSSNMGVTYEHALWKCWVNILLEGYKADTLKIFLWDGINCDYTCGMAVAQACSVEHALEIFRWCQNFSFFGGSEEDVMQYEVIDPSKPFGTGAYGGG
jgi:hypothetical protein